MIPVVLFALAAAGGVIMAVQRFRGAPQPALPLALGHGLFAASGLVALLASVLGGTGGHAKIALILFIVAALGGFVLFGMHMTKRALPIPLVVVHALVAVSAFGLLLTAVL